MRTPSREMMSHIYRENIFMSPFPRFEIPKMIGFRTNTDSSSIIDGEYLLESSLHPAPASSWLDFRYKEKKKSDEGNDGRGNDGNRKTIDFTLVFCLTVYYNGAKKFNQLSRNYRHFDTGEFYFGFYRVQFVQVPTSSCTSCVSFDFQSSYFSQYSFYARQQMPSDIAYLLLRHLTHAPISMLRHLNDLNLTQLIHLLQAKNLTNKLKLHLLEVQGNGNKNSNNDSNNERVFQNDGECIVIRFSTLIDRKERKKLSSKQENSIINVPILQVLLNCINKKENDNVDVSVLNLILNLSKEVCCDYKNDIDIWYNEERLIDNDDNNDNDNEKYIDYVLILLSNRTSNDDDNYASAPTLLFKVSSIDSNNERNNVTRVLTPLSKLVKCNDNDNNNKKCIDFIFVLFSKLSKRYDNDDDHSANDNRIDPDESVLNLFIPKVSTNRTDDTGCEVNNIINDVIQGERDVSNIDTHNSKASILTLQVISNCTKIDHDNKKENIDKDNDDDDFNEIENTKVFDRVSKRISALHPVDRLSILINDEEYNVFIIIKVPNIAAELSIRVWHQNINCTSAKHIGRADFVITISGEFELISTLNYLSYDYARNGDSETITEEEQTKSERQEEDEERSIEFIIEESQDRYVQRNKTHIVRTVHGINSNSTNYTNANDKEEQLNVSVSLIDGECVMIIIILSKLSKRTSSNNGDERSDNKIISIILSELLNHNNDTTSVLIILSRLSNRIHRNNKNIIDNNGDDRSDEKIILLLLSNPPVALSICDNHNDNNQTRDGKMSIDLDSFINNDDNDMNKMKETTLSIDDINNDDYTLVITKHTNNDRIISFKGNDNLNMNDKYDYEKENETTAKSLDGNSIDTSQLGLFMGSVCEQLFCLVLVIGSDSVLATCIQEYDYDIILKALFVFNCSILYWIFTIDGEYQNLQRARILVDDISLYESSWNRALRLDSYLSSSKQQQAAKRGEMSQILHVM